MASAVVGVRFESVAYWGVGDLEQELARVRALRARPPGLAVDGQRRDVFSAALEQFEQLLHAAERSGPASAPLPLFYALSQAGRAIAAAQMKDDARWDYTGHGLSGTRKYGHPIGSAPVAPQRTGAFQVVAEATGSAPLASATTLEELWASLPHTLTQEGLGHERPRALRLTPVNANVVTGDVETSCRPEPNEADGRTSLETLLSDYPSGSGGAYLSHVYTPSGARFRVQWPDKDAVQGTSQIADSYWSESQYYLRPRVAGQRPPSTLMTWWAVLFVLSQLARYAPQVWTQAITPDVSVLTVPIEEGLRLAKRSLPRLVYHGLTESWD